MRRGADATYTSPDGAFQFKYSGSLVWCHEAAGDDNRWEPLSSCMSQMPMCHEHAIACLAYPRAEYIGYNFTPAGFSVSVISGIDEGEEDLERTCEVPLHRAAINGIKFRIIKCEDVGLGSAYYTELYRTCHEGVCYELDVRIAASQYANYEPGTINRFTQKDWNKVHGRLKQMVDTFRFLKQP